MSELVKKNEEREEFFVGLGNLSIFFFYLNVCHETKVRQTKLMRNSLILFLGDLKIEFCIHKKNIIEKNKGYVSITFCFF